MNFVTKIIYFYILLTSVGLVSQVIAEEPSVVDQVAALQGGCRRGVNDTYQAVHTGWPTKFSCYGLEEKFVSAMISQNIDIFSFQVEAQCLVRDFASYKTLWNKTYPFDPFQSGWNHPSSYITQDITEESPETYIVIFKVQNNCTFQIVHLNVTNEYLEQDCENLSEKISNEFEVVSGDPAELSCETPGSVEPSLHFGEQHADNVSYTWHYNCTDHLKDNTRINHDMLSIYNTSFDNAGTYECLVNYNGKTRYVIRHLLCVRYKSTIHAAVTFKCTDKMEVSLGDDVTINCTADVGLGKANNILLNAHWNKTDENGNMTCDNLAGERVDNSSQGSRAQCSMHSPIIEECSLYNPNMPPPREILNVTFTIRNVQEADLGLYTVKFTVSASSYEVVQNVTLVLQQDDVLKGRITAIAVPVCFLLVVIILVLIAIWRKDDVRWYWKKHFGPYEKEFCTYTAYLAYYYDDSEDRMSAESKKLTCKLVSNLHEFMQKFGGTTYDDQKDVNPHQYKAENIFHVQKECHRVIIILSPEYVEDEWSVHEAYRALQNVIKEGKKIIFLVMPGAEKALKALPKEPKTTLERAMKMNKTIQWSGKVPFSTQFRRRLEYALPKLPPPNYNRYLSNSSQAHLTYCNTHLSNSTTPSSEGSEMRFNSMIV